MCGLNINFFDAVHTSGWRLAHALLLWPDTECVCVCVWTFFINKFHSTRLETRTKKCGTVAWDFHGCTIMLQAAPSGGHRDSHAMQKQQRAKVHGFAVSGVAFLAS